MPIAGGAIPSLTQRECAPAFIYDPTPACLYQESAIGWLILVKRTFKFPNAAAETDPVAWTAAITAGNIIIFPVSGKMNEPEPIMIEGKGGIIQQYAYSNHSFKVYVNDPDRNFNAIKSINQKSKDYGVMLTFRGDKNTWAIMGSNAGEYEYVGLSSGYSMEKEIREWYIDGKWRAAEMPYLASFGTPPASVLP